jgi:hypothetical protein
MIKCGINDGNRVLFDYIGGGSVRGSLLAPQSASLCLRYHQFCHRISWDEYYVRFRSANQRQREERKQFKLKYGASEENIATCKIQEFSQQV